jgi:hypothetical protein
LPEANGHDVLHVGHGRHLGLGLVARSRNRWSRAENAIEVLDRGLQHLGPTALEQAGGIPSCNCTLTCAPWISMARTQPALTGSWFR